MPVTTVHIYVQYLRNLRNLYTNTHIEYFYFRANDHVDREATNVRT